MSTSRKKNDTATLEEQDITQSVQIRVAQVFSRWIKSPVSSYDFDEPDSYFNKEALQFLQDLKKNLNCIPHLQKLESRLTKKTKTVSPKSNSLMVAVTDITFMSEDNAQITINNFDPETVADYLTAFEFEIFKKIHPIEFLKQGWNKQNASEISPNIVSINTRFNDIILWVIFEILSGNTPKDRLQIILHFILIAKALKKRSNFNGFAAIMSGINNSSVTRLKKTIGKLAEEKNSGSEELTELISGVDNFQGLRDMWANVGPPSIPFLAITLRDLTLLEDANPDILEDGGINCYKWRKIAEIIQNILDYQHVSYAPVINQALQMYLHSKMDSAKQLGQTGLFAKSKKCE